MTGTVWRGTDISCTVETGDELVPGSLLQAAARLRGAALAADPVRASEHG